MASRSTGSVAPSAPRGVPSKFRFGTKDGERRAYLTADYGHENPGTLVDVDVVGGALFVKRLSVFPGLPRCVASCPK